MRETAADKMAISLFPVADTLEYCIRHRPDFESEGLTDNVEAKGAFDGLEAAKRQFISAMKSVNISEIVPQVGDEVTYFSRSFSNGLVRPHDAQRLLSGRWKR